MRWFFFSILLINLCAEEPWGLDADLLQKRAQAPVENRDFLQRMTRVVICFHKRVISPADGPRSHFKPSSSEYMLQSIERYGFFYGYLLGCDRLMRENRDPWVYRSFLGDYNQVTKWDPIR